MIDYEVYVQENYIGIFQAKNTGYLLSIISKQIKNGEITVNPNIPHNIKAIKVK